MADTVSPADALSPEAFYSLYLGGLIVEDETERLELCYTLLALGRLGLRPAEFLHLHEGWVDWGRGEIHVPARDPCGCSLCWDSARQRRRQGDSRDLETIVAEECWTPGEQGARRLSFGWSRRLTAVVDGVLDAGSHLTSDRKTVHEHVKTAAMMAQHVDRTDASVDALRASALTFLASAGFGPRRLADLTATDEETAGEFARVGGGEVRSHLYRVLGDVDSPSLCDGDSSYRLVCDPTAVEREPVDPTGYDAEWRRTRAEQSEQRDRNPRPVSPPDGVDFGSGDLQGVGEPSGRHGPGLVPTSLAEWVEQRERKRTGDDSGESTDSAAGKTASGSDDGGRAGGDNPLEVTKPVTFSMDTRLVAPGFESGRPTGGSVLLGQEELLFLSRGAGGIADYLRVDLDWIVNIAPGYVPDTLEGLFDDTVAIAYHGADGDRRIVVAEIPPDIRWQFVQTVYAGILDGEQAVVTHQPGTPVAVGPHERAIDAATERLLLERVDGGGPPLRLRLAQLVGVERGQMTAEERYETGLRVTRLQDGKLVDMELRPVAEPKVSILEQYLGHFDDRQRQRARSIQLSREETDLLERLYDAEDGRDLAGMLDRGPETLSAMMDRLADRGLVLDGSSGKRLTGVGYRLVSPEYDL